MLFWIGFQISNLDIFFLMSHENCINYFSVPEMSSEDNLESTISVIVDRKIFVAA